MKAGIKTSEFWVTLGGTVVSFLVLSGVVEPVNANQLTESLTQVISGVVALGSIVSYILSRTELKKEEMRIQAKG